MSEEKYIDYEEALHFEGDFEGEPIITKAGIHDNGDIHFHQSPKTGDNTFRPDDIVGFSLEELKEVVETAEELQEGDTGSK